MSHGSDAGEYDDVHVHSDNRPGLSWGTGLQLPGSGLSFEDCLQVPGSG